MDRLLAVLFAVWALLAFLPVGAWTGVSTAAYYAEAWGLWVRTLGVIGLVTILVLVLGGERVGRGLRRTLAAVFALPLALYLAGLGVIALLEATAVAYWYFGRMPPVIDAWVQYFQARVLLTGEWVAPPAASPAHFGILFAPITAHGWFGQHPPIHPALLALGLAAGVPWLVTPLLAAALPAAVYALGAGSGDRRVARLAAALVVVSPFVIAIDASAMNHVGAALTVAFGLASLGAVAAGSARAGVVLGAAVGLTLGLRPLDAAVLAVVGAPAVLGGIRTRGGLAMAAGATLAGLAMLAPTLAYNHATSGSIMTFTYSAVWGELMGLDHDVPWGTSLTLQRALGLTAVDAHQMDVYLLEWPLPVTALVALGCWLGCGRRAPGAYGAPAYLLGLVGALFFYFHRDTLFGPRLLFSAAPSMLVMLAAGVVALTDLRRPLRGTRLALGDVALVALAITAVLAASTLAPRRLASHRTIGSPVALHPEEDAERAGVERALVFISDGLGSRLIARMWAGGVPMTASTQLYRSADACRLTDALAVTEAAVAPGPEFRARLEQELVGASTGRRAPGTTPDALLRFPDDGKASPRCVAEINRDRRGTLQFAPYLYLNDPALAGPIVWAREVGAADVALARRYADRPVYRYRGPQRDGANPFVLLAERGELWDGQSDDVR